jgi:nitroimidazol reductase NimA-like FMN-containing flavoprotein (pyridoxamine 5'-phosphate oxidase superfamily)
VVVRNPYRVTRNTALFEMHAEECADLLASATLGRLAVVIDGHPEVFPVNHVYEPDSGYIAFPSNVGTKLHAALASPSVAFEADGFCPDGSRGWSVLVVGKVEEIDDPETITRLATNREQLWRTGSSTQWLRVVPSKMTGRRICNPDRSPSAATG